MSTAVSFNTNDMQTAGIITSVIAHDTSPEQVMQINEIAHANRSTVSHIAYPKKVIPHTGTLKADTVAGLDTLIDTFKSYFKVKDKNLDIGYGGSTRRYICTPKMPKIERPNGLNWARFSLEYVATDPFGRDTTTTSLLSQDNRTSSTYTDTLTVAGTAPEQLPVVTILIDAVTGGTGKTITISNDSTGQTISVTADFANGDEVVFDSYNSAVYINDIEVDFDGAFLKFETGSHDFSYSDNFTTRTFDIDIDYYKRYL